MGEGNGFLNNLILKTYDIQTLMLAIFQFKIVGMYNTNLYFFAYLFYSDAIISFKISELSKKRQEITVEVTGYDKV